MTSAEIVAALDSLQPGDKEAAHGVADDLLLSAVPEDVRSAYERARQRIGFWYA